MRRRRFRGLSRLRGESDWGSPQEFTSISFARNGTEWSKKNLLYTIRPSEYTPLTQRSTHIHSPSLPSPNSKQTKKSTPTHRTHTRARNAPRLRDSVYPIFAPATIFPISTLSSSKFVFSVLASSNFLCSFASLIKVSNSASCSNNGCSECATAESGSIENTSAPAGTDGVEEVDDPNPSFVGGLGDLGNALCNAK